MWAAHGVGVYGGAINSERVNVGTGIEVVNGLDPSTDS